MGNHQKPQIEDHKLYLSEFTMKQHSNMPSAITYKKKLVERNQQHKVIENNKASNNTHGMMEQITFDERNNPPRPQNDQSAVRIKEPSQTVNDQEESLRATHVDMLTKKSEMRDKQQNNFTVTDSGPGRSYRSAQHEKAQLNLKVAGENRDKQKAYHRSELRPNLNENHTPYNQHQLNKDKKTPSQNPSISVQSKQANYMKVPSAIDDLDTIQLNQSNRGEYLRNPIVGSQQSTMMIDNSSFQRRGYFLVTDTQPGEKGVQKKEKQIQKQKPNQGKENNNEKPFFLTSWLSDVFMPNKSDNNSQIQPPKNTNCSCNITMPIMTIFSSSQSSKSTQNPEQRKSPTMQQYQRELQLPPCKAVADRKKSDKKNDSERQIKGVSKSY